LLLEEFREFGYRDLETVIPPNRPSLHQRLIRLEPPAVSVPYRETKKKKKKKKK